MNRNDKPDLKDQIIEFIALSMIVITLIIFFVMVVF